MVAAASESLSYLLRSQNADGGWSYRPSGSSWTEPTCLAVLALGSAPGEHAKRGLDWLVSQRRSDGGWGPRTGVAESTWVTALGLITMYKAGRAGSGDAALRWLTAAAGAESNWIVRLRSFLLGGGKGGDDTSNQGWPWYPGASAWVAPTSTALLALDRIHRLHPNAALLQRSREGKVFLLARRCADGGWNHGSSRALGYDGPSYAETTGMALLALAGEPGVPRQSIDRAVEHLNRCRGVEAWSWLQMGLCAQRIRTAAPVSNLRIHDLREASLYLLAEAALAGLDPFGRN